MALVDTAELIAYLQLKDGLTTPANQAKQAVTGLDRAVENTSGRVSMMSRATAGAGQAMGHFRGKVGDLTKNLGMLGLGGAALAAFGFLKSATGEAMGFADAIDRVSTLTGLGAQRTSQFVDALGYYGIGADQAQRITGMYIKTVDGLTKSKKDAAKFEREYGFSLLDSRGKVLQADQVITKFTDFFNDKTIPMQTRAAAGAKLFGRAWQDLLPVFQAGGREWRAQLEAGLKLTPAQLKSARDMRNAQRDWNDALGDFKVIAGLEVLPIMTKLAKAASEWLNDPGNQKTLIGFLHDGIRMGETFATYLTGTLLPAMRDVGQAASGFWNMIPGPLQELLVKGMVADRTIKYLFGFSLTGVAGNLVGDAIKGGFKGLGSMLGLTRGSSPANPMYVAGALGGVGGAAGRGGAAGGGLMGGKAGMLLGAVSIVGAALYALEGIQDFMGTVAGAQKSLAQKAEAESTKGGSEVLKDLTGFVAHLKGLGIIESTAANTFGSKELGAALRNQGARLAELAQQNKLDRQQVADAITGVEAAIAEAKGRGWEQVATDLTANLAALKAKLPTAPEIGQAVADATPATPKPEDKPETATPKTVKVRADPRASRDIGAAVAASLGRPLTTLGTRITTAQDRGTTLLRQLRAGQLLDGLVQRAQVTQAMALGRSVAGLRAQLAVANARELAYLAAIAAKRTTLNAYTNVSVSTYVSSRDVEYRTNVATRYGAQAV